jgi:hypothetical protein
MPGAAPGTASQTASGTAPNPIPGEGKSRKTKAQNLEEVPEG